MTETDGNPPLNPYTVTLFWVAIAAFALAGLILLFTLGSFDREVVAGGTIWAGLLGNLGIAAALLWLVASAISWRPSVATPGASKESEHS